MYLNTGDQPIEQWGQATSKALLVAVECRHKLCGGRRGTAASSVCVDTVSWRCRHCCAGLTAACLAVAVVARLRVACGCVTAGHVGRSIPWAAWRGSRGLVLLVARMPPANEPACWAADVLRAATLCPKF
jgi:hypothetical protein